VLELELEPRDRLSSLAIDLHGRISNRTLREMFAVMFKQAIFIQSKKRIEERAGIKMKA
jgi:hypothetical protein